MLPLRGGLLYRRILATATLRTIIPYYRCSSCKRWQSAITRSKQKHLPLPPLPRQAVCYKSQSTVDIEQQIWLHIQCDRFSQAASLTPTAYRIWQQSSIPLSSLTQFIMAKRQFTIECLYAGIFALLQEQQQQQHDRLNVVTMLLAALLADTDNRLLNKYNSMSTQQRRQVDAVLSGATYFHLLHQNNLKWARLVGQQLSEQSKQAVEWARQNPQHMSSMIPPKWTEKIGVAWALRHSTTTSMGDSAGKLVDDLLRNDIVPDQGVFQSLLRLAAKGGKSSLAAILPVYTSNHYPQSIRRTTLIRLASVREDLGRREERLHYDVIAAMIRSGNALEDALVVASAIQTQHIFYWLLQQWACQYPKDWKSIVDIVHNMLKVLNHSKFLHSTHHLVISLLVKQQSALDRNEVLDAALLVHQKLSPRLESPSVAAIHQLMRALVEYNRVTDAYGVYRDAEQQKSNWTFPSGQSIANEAIFSVLGSAMAMCGDLKSLAYLTNIATKSGVKMTVHFYTAVICGLVLPIKQATKDYPNRDRRRMAEAIFRTMCRNGIQPSTKAYHAIMHALVKCGHSKRVRMYFDRMKAEQDKPEAAIAKINEVTWSILLHSYAAVRDTKNALNTLASAREWLEKENPKRTSSGHRTSYLINTAVSALVEAGDVRQGLVLLDKFLAEDPQQMAISSGLAVTAADPATLSIVIKALLINQQLSQAVKVYETIRDQYNLNEAATQWKPMLKYCLDRNDSAGAMQISMRILSIDNDSNCPELTNKQWIRLLKLCHDHQDYPAIVRLYDRLLSEKRTGPNLLQRHPLVAELISDSLYRVGRSKDALAIPSHSCYHNPATRLISSHRHRCLILYRDLLRAIHRFPLVKMRRKLKYNARFCFELYRDISLEQDSQQEHRIKELIQDGQRQLQWLRSWQNQKDLRTWNGLLK